MIELIVATYGLGCWLIFKKFRLVPTTTYTVCTAVLGGIVILFTLMVVLSICHPVSHDGRLYSVVTQIVPQVRGKVTEVPVEPNTPVRTGDVLFQIDPTPYQLEVERLEAMLAGLNAEVAQLDARLASAQATTAGARSNLLISESEYDRQARIALDAAKSQIVQVESRLQLAEQNLARSRELRKSGAATQEEVDADTARADSLRAELATARTSEGSAKETLDSGGARLQAARDALKQAEAAEQEALIARDAESDGMNPDVRRAMAELDRKRWDLEQTAVRAPSDGYVTFLSLRPGQMVTPISTNAAVVFVPNEKAYLRADFTQAAIGGIEPGLEAEIAFKAYPGQVFPAKVAAVLPIMPEGQFVGSGQVQSTPGAEAKGAVPVLFEYGEEVEALDLPSGAQASIAIYTHHVHALAIVRKIILRIKSWENYAFFLSGLDAVH